MYKKTQCLVAMMIYGLHCPSEATDNPVRDIEEARIDEKPILDEKSILPELVQQARKGTLDADGFRNLRAEIHRIPTFAMKLFANPQNAHTETNKVTEDTVTTVQNTQRSLNP